ncbi:uncharacterized protein LOC121421258 [Lytechinus variegatus]|uniref:uncharacterized protein LOC121421258 n=1 Tax=Lytechinus variegatus TaxID=7654 RepID=UPI001BB26FD0|nr:uncharacterized protein LOC121421258 [Lytechinus variegatus]
MSVELEKLRDILNTKGGVNVQVDAKKTDERSRFSYKYRADILTTEEYISVTYEGANQIARTLPKLVKENTNGGKGVPLKYYLMSLENARRKLRVDASEDISYKKIDKCTGQKVLQFLEELNESSRKVYDIYHEMNHNGAFISDKALSRTEEVWVEVSARVSSFKTDLLEIVQKVRAGEDNISVLEEFVSTMNSEDVSASKYAEELEPYLLRIRCIRSMISKGVKHIGKNDELVKDAKENTFVFYIPSGSDEEAVEKNRDLLMRLLSTFSEDDMSEFIAVDQEIVSTHIWPDKVKRPTIEKYVDGIRTSEDLYEEEGKNLEECLIQAHHFLQMSAPRKPALVKLKCPNAIVGNGCCAGDPLKWRCSICGHLVHYSATIKMFYCTCGAWNPRDSRFRCNDPRHGLKFMKYPKDLLWDDLSKLNPMKEVNILILGETGVGKSTLINGILNYLTFPNLAEAMNSQDFPVLIPFSFTLTQDGEQREIKVGVEDSNEVQEVGKSATKEPRSYVFTVGDRRVRLIDTPGIGDCSGIKQDERNMHNILSHLTFYTEINAICILLKPNNSRLTAMFLFYIQELLVQLHNSAKNNIVFCFTNARQTFYQPGDTLPALNKELEKRNVGIKATKDKYFCFDNEPFRFLACIKNGVTFDDGDIATYSSSWDKSVKETGRLLKYIECHLKPHRVKETLGKNEARRIIIAMSKPLAEVGNAINHNLYAAREINAKFGHAIPEINTILDFKAKKEASITEINKKVEELKAEQKIILATGAKFGSILKANALNTYNDAVEEYLEMCIKQEKAKPATLRKEDLLENMTKMKAEYKKQREIAGGANENITTAEEVKDLQEGLFKLKHFGGTLRKLFEEIFHVQQGAYHTKWYTANLPNEHFE